MRRPVAPRCEVVLWRHLNRHFNTEGRLAGLESDYLTPNARRGSEEELQAARLFVK